eukprot:GHVT01008268.1.p1 GENE.GHVT01008268.1~~GHVT01008268.1.p1  ORF type:complete len:790 (-),score=77.41 GHVT01008268.1:95-2464(-)
MASSSGTDSSEPSWKTRKVDDCGIVENIVQMLRHVTNDRKIVGGSVSSIANSDLDGWERGSTSHTVWPLTIDELLNKLSSPQQNNRSVFRAFPWLFRERELKKRVTASKPNSAQSKTPKLKVVNTKQNGNPVFSIWASAGKDECLTHFLAVNSKLPNVYAECNALKNAVLKEWDVSVIECDAEASTSTEKMIDKIVEGITVCLATLAANSLGQQNISTKVLEKPAGFEYITLDDPPDFPATITEIFQKLREGPKPLRKWLIGFSNVPGLVKFPDYSYVDANYKPENAYWIVWPLNDDSKGTHCRKQVGYPKIWNIIESEKHDLVDLVGKKLDYLPKEVSTLLKLQLQAECSGTSGQPPINLLPGPPAPKTPPTPVQQFPPTSSANSLPVPVSPLCPQNHSTATGTLSAHLPSPVNQTPATCTPASSVVSSSESDGVQLPQPVGDCDEGVKDEDVILFNITKAIYQEETKQNPFEIPQKVQRNCFSPENIPKSHSLQKTEFLSKVACLPDKNALLTSLPGMIRYGPPTNLKELKANFTPEGNPYLHVCWSNSSGQWFVVEVGTWDEWQAMTWNTELIKNFIMFLDDVSQEKAPATGEVRASNVEVQCLENSESQRRLQSDADALMGHPDLAGASNWHQRSGANGEKLWCYEYRPKFNAVKRVETPRVDAFQNESPPSSNSVVGRDLVCRNLLLTAGIGTALLVICALAVTSWQFMKRKTRSRPSLGPRRRFRGFNRKKSIANSDKAVPDEVDMQSKDVSPSFAQRSVNASTGSTSSPLVIVKQNKQSPKG